MTLNNSQIKILEIYKKIKNNSTNDSDIWKLNEKIALGEFEYKNMLHNKDLYPGTIRQINTRLKTYMLMDFLHKII